MTTTDKAASPTDLHDHQKCKACYQTSAALAAAQEQIAALEAKRWEDVRKCADIIDGIIGNAPSPQKPPLPSASRKRSSEQF